jgi:hypothetical protein
VGAGGRHPRPAPRGVAGRQPGRPGQRPVRPSLVFAWRALLKIKHLPEQLIDVISIPIIFTLGFTHLFGGALAGSTHTYLQFLLPGSLARPRRRPSRGATPPGWSRPADRASVTNPWGFP